MTPFDLVAEQIQNPALVPAVFAGIGGATDGCTHPAAAISSAVLGIG